MIRVLIGLMLTLAMAAVAFAEEDIEAEYDRTARRLKARDGFPVLNNPKTTVLTGKKANGFMGAFNLSRDLPRYGLSVGQSRTAKLYPFSLLAKKRVINDEFDGEKTVVVYDAKSITGVVYRRGERTFAFKEGKLVDEAGTEWDLLAGTAGREKLERLPATPWLTARWRTFYPKGEIHR